MNDPFLDELKRIRRQLKRIADKLDPPLTPYQGPPQDGPTIHTRENITITHFDEDPTRDTDK